MWPRRPRLPRTTSHDQCAQTGRNTIDIWLCTRARHRDGVDMPDAGLHPHREAMHKQHTEPGPSCCVPFGDPHVHTVKPSDETRQECNHSSATPLGPIHRMARTHQADDKSKGRKRRGASAKSSVLILTCVPLPHLVLPLSGWPAQAPRPAIRGVPLPNPHRNIVDNPVRGKALRLGGQSGSS